MNRRRIERASKCRERGAIFVEAIIVISTFVLIMLSMVFFKNMYLKKISVARLARASVVAYSMQGCPPGQEPANWASIDLDSKAGKHSPPPATTTVPTPHQPAIPSKRAGNITKQIPGAGSDGSSLNPIADLGFSMRASATTKTGALSPRKGYGKTMESVSFVSCGEEMRGDSLKDIVGYALGQFNLGGKSEDSDEP